MFIMGIIENLFKKEARIIDIQVKEKIKIRDCVLLNSPSYGTLQNSMPIFVDMEYSRVANDKDESLLIRPLFSDLKEGEKIHLKIEERTYFNRFTTHSYEIKRNPQQNWEPVDAIAC